MREKIDSKAVEGKKKKNRREKTKKMRSKFMVRLKLCVCVCVGAVVAAVVEEKSVKAQR